MSDERRQNFGREISVRRRSKGWDQHELARRVGSTATTISRWENGVSVPNAGAVIALKRELLFTEEDFISAFGVISSTPTRNRGRYKVCSFRTAKGIFGSFEAIHDAFYQIEERFPVPEEPGEYGEDEKWLELLKLSPDSGGMVIFDHKQSVGYWQCLAVNDDTYRNVVAGRNVNCTISANDVEILMQPGSYKLYFVSLFLLEEHRNFVARKLLRLDFLDFLREAAEEGIYFSHIAANVTGLEARRVCESLGFQKVINHSIHRYAAEPGAPKHAEIFELDIYYQGARLFGLDRELEEKYSVRR